MSVNFVCLTLLVWCWIVRLLVFVWCGMGLVVLVVFGEFAGWFALMVLFMGFGVCLAGIGGFRFRQLLLCLL